jgi:hypothetical protein
VIEGSNLLQDLDQILGAELTGSTARLDEGGQPDVLHPASSGSMNVATRTYDLSAKALSTSASGDAAPLSERIARGQHAGGPHRRR